jgi:hypothetical protein
MSRSNPRCTGLRSDLDGELAGSRTRELTSHLVNLWDPLTLWDEYGIDESIVVCSEFPLHVELI